MKKLILLSILFIFSSLAYAYDFDGTWSGQGFVVTLDEKAPTEALFQLVLQLAEDKLTLEQCVLTQDGESQQDCFSATYKVQNDSIYNQFDEKIGDIFPDKIAIFESTSQVSEQIQIDLNAKGEMRYNYSYGNLDGASIHKRAYLKKE